MGGERRREVGDCWRRIFSFLSFFFSFFFFLFFFFFFPAHKGLRLAEGMQNKPAED